MPKIANGTGPSYEGHAGVVVDARDRRWNVDPERDIAGEKISDEPVEDEAAESHVHAPEPGTDAARVADEEQDEDGEDERDRDSASMDQGSQSGQAAAGRATESPSERNAAKPAKRGTSTRTTEDK